MGLPYLVPRAEGSVVTTAQPCKIATHEQWIDLRPIIERLYLREKRKLRYVRQHMEEVYGLRATEQMYKKRLAQWGAHKNTRRQAAPKTCSRPSECPKRSTTSSLRPHMTDRERMMMLFVTSVRNWSTAYFEDMDNRIDMLEDPVRAQNRHLSQPCPDAVKHSNITFSLAIELLRRGHGALSGRVARKAFLLIEDTLCLESPALVWNLLEIMHSIVILGQVKLYRLLLAHLTALVSRRMSPSHPLSRILHGLRGVFATLADSLPGDELPGDCPRDACFFPEMLERAWNLNAEMVFNHFDPRLFELYFRIHWDSCRLTPPKAIIGALRRYYTPEEHMAEYPCISAGRDGMPPISIAAEAAVVQRILGGSKPSSPQGYEYVCGAIWRRIESLLREDDYTDIQTTTLMRILAGLVKAKFLVEQPEIFQRPESLAYCKSSPASRVHASNVACAMLTLVELDECAPDGDPLDLVELTRSIVALREYANGETHPQVIQEMWMLEDALRGAGREVESKAVGGQAMHRLEAYIQDIPADRV